jgi:hypothetical protein
LSLGETTRSGKGFFSFLTGTALTGGEGAGGLVVFGFSALGKGAALLTWLF